MRPSPYYDRLVDVMEELMKFLFDARHLRLPDEPLFRTQGRRQKACRASGVEGRLIAGSSSSPECCLPFLSLESSCFFHDLINLLRIHLS